MPIRILVKPGERFGRLTIINEVAKRNKQRYFLCVCDCGKKREVRYKAMRAGEVKSCGCAKNEQSRARSITHGLSGTALYSSWHCMKQRCLNPNSKVYLYYGGRGITVCEEWLQFESFCKWALANGYKKGLTIERVDCNGNYEPSNCKWIPQKEQIRNTRRSRRITFNGQTMLMKDWAINIGICPESLRGRLKNGWSIEKALTTPLIGKFSSRKAYIK